MTDQDSEASRASARLGVVLRGKYRLDRVLGIGGMAVVYAATHRNGMEVAVKVLHAELTSRKDIRERFLREGLAANTLKHPGAVAVLDDDVAEDGSAFLVMELLKGETLEAVWERCGRHVDLPTVLAAGFQLCDILAAAHAHGITHRDIKPANLFLTVAGQLKVLDFGIARLRELSAASATTTGMMLGTPAFMAPEQASGDVRAVGPQSDVYAVGATLFTLASGDFVHNGENGQQMVIRSATTPARSLATAVRGLPPAMVAVVDRALAFRPADRWPSAAEMRDAIRAAHSEAFGPMPSAIPLPALTGLAWFHPDGPTSISNQTTAIPVALARAAPGTTGTTAAPAPPVGRAIARGIAFAAAVAALASGGTYLSLRRPLTGGAVTTQAASAATPPPAATADTPPSARPAPPTPPVEAPRPAPASPVAADTSARPPAPDPSARPRPSPPGHDSRGADCTPPYTVDAHGMHHWKLSCL